jgi:hypothetical protein
MVELVQSAWGDWWIVAGGRPVAVHLRNRSDVKTEASARKHAATLFPTAAVTTTRFRTNRDSPQLDVDGADEPSAVNDLVADEPHTLGRDRRRPAA